MTFITTLSWKKNDTDLLFTDTDSPTYEINQKMFMKKFLNINTYLTLVIINQSFLIQKNKKVIGKMKD